MYLRYSRDGWICLPCSPAMWEEIPKYKKITVLKICCGSGLGDQSWTEYVERVPELIPNTIQEFTRIKDGRKIKVNTSFITMSSDYTMAYAKFETSNPHGKEQHPDGVMRVLVDDDTKCYRMDYHGLIEDWTEKV